MVVESIRAGSACRERGFTLVELAITLVVLAVLVTLAAPSFTNMTQRNRLTAAANEVSAILQVARMDAISRGQAVTVCPSPDGSTCGISEGWSRLIVFVDPDRTAAVVDKDDFLRELWIDGAGLSVDASSNVAAGPWIRFSADGLVRMSGNGRQGAITVCSSRLPPESDNARDIHVGVSRVSVSSRNATPDCTAPNN